MPTTEIELTNVPSQKFQALSPGTAFVHNGGLFIRCYSQEFATFIRMIDDVKDHQPSGKAPSGWMPWGAVELPADLYVRVCRGSKLTVEL